MRDSKYNGLEAAAQGGFKAGFKAGLEAMEGLIEERVKEAVAEAIADRDAQWMARQNRTAEILFGPVNITK